VMWVNVSGVHKVDVLEAFGKQFGLHPLLLEDIANTDQRPKLDDYETCLFLVVKMLTMDDQGNLLVEQVSFVLGRNYVLSFQENGTDVFRPVRDRLRGGKGRLRQHGSDYLLYALVDAVVDEYFAVLEILGETPLPKYIKRKPDEEDKERYQTVYAKHEGAVAAPTAGLHFSRELIKRLEIKGIRFAEVTLHTGLGTFRPIEVEDLSKHKMDAEYYRIDEEACKIVNRAKEYGHRICSIGTTTMRGIESSFTAQKLLKPSEGWTNMFIHPPYEFNIADSLVTNFHLPKTSLLIMTCAFAGYELVMEAYKKAIKDKYRFFSYGDALLIV